VLVRSLVRGPRQFAVAHASRGMARLSRDGDPPALKGIFAGGELREGHSLASARTHHEAQRYALNTACTKDCCSSACRACVGGERWRDGRRWASRCVRASAAADLTVSRDAREDERRSRRAAEPAAAHVTPRRQHQGSLASFYVGDVGSERTGGRTKRASMDATYGRVMKQALGEDDGGYSSKNRFDRPFHAADTRCPNTSCLPGKKRSGARCGGAV